MTRQRITLLLIIAALVAGLLYGTWILPYRFPLRDFVIGASYEVGFNNGVSYLAYLIFIPLLALAAAPLLRGPRTVVIEESHQGARFSGTIAAIVISAHIALFSALYLYRGRFVFGEGLYFQSLLYRMSLGEIPYINFSFYYGPLMLYPAHWLGSLVGLDAAYGIWFVTTYVTGLLFLYTVVNYCVGNDRARGVWFAFLAMGLFNPLTGLNETFTRFLFPTIVFLATAGFLRNGGRTRGLAAAVALAAAITYSFEVAVLSVGAVVSLWLLYTAAPVLIPLLRRLNATQAQREGSGRLDEGPPPSTLFRRAAIILGSAGAFLVGLFLLIDSTGRALRDYSGVAWSYSGGAHNVPIYPHAPFIAMAIATVAALAAFITLALRTRDGLVAAAAITYSGVALLAQRAAFGAAEPSHFAYFGLPAFCAAIFAATADPRAHNARVWLAGVLLVGIILPMQYYHFMEFVPFFTRRLQLPVAMAESVPVGRPEMSLEQKLRAVVETLGNDRPYLMYEMEYSSLPVYRDYGLKYPTYFTMLINARDAKGIQQSIDEIRDKQAIVVVRREDLEGLERPRQSGSILQWLDLISGAHTAGSNLNAVLLKSRTRLTAPLLEFVQSEFTPLYDHNGLVAYGPREIGTR